MTTTYPGAVDSFAAVTGTMADAPTHSTRHTNTQDAIVAVQTELGTDPSGSFATVKARLEAIEANDWVTSARIAANAVTADELADNAVDTNAIANGAVTDAKLAGSITATKITGTALVATTVDAKGDILAATAADTVARVAVGANNTILTADSSATPGIKWAAPAVLVGTGSPLSVVTPGFVGQYFVDTAATNGATRWRASTSAASGWVVVEGDTGWRNITSLIVTAVWTPESGADAPQLRRIGNEVRYRGRCTAAAAWHAQTAFVFPAGFVGIASPHSILRTQSDGVTLPGASIDFSGSNVRFSRMLGMGPSGNRDAANTILMGGGTWTTNDAWPTSLPGTPV